MAALWCGFSKRPERVFFICVLLYILRTFPSVKGHMEGTQRYDSRKTALGRACVQEYSESGIDCFVSLWIFLGRLHSSFGWLWVGEFSYRRERRSEDPLYTCFILSSHIIQAIHWVFSGLIPFSLMDFCQATDTTKTDRGITVLVDAVLAVVCSVTSFPYSIRLFILFFLFVASSVRNGARMKPANRCSGRSRSRFSVSHRLRNMTLHGLEFVELVELL